MRPPLLQLIGLSGPEQHSCSMVPVKGISKGTERVRCRNPVLLAAYGVVKPSQVYWCRFFLAFSTVLLYPGHGTGLSYMGSSQKCWWSLLQQKGAKRPEFMWFALEKRNSLPWGGSYEPGTMNENQIYTLQYHKILNETEIEKYTISMNEKTQFCKDDGCP